jgi:hypothetical protein
MDRSTGGGVGELDGVGAGARVGADRGTRDVRVPRRAAGPRPVRPAVSVDRVPALRRGAAVDAGVGGGVGAASRLIGVGESTVRAAAGSDAVVVPLRPVTPGARLQEPRVVPSERPVSAAPVSARRYAVRRAVAVAALGLLSMLVVVVLGLVAQASGADRARAGVPTGSETVLVEPGDTVWDVARREVPEADAAAVVERIVADNGLGSASVGVLPAGTVLHVPA